MKINYSKLRDCKDFSSWLYSEWSYWCGITHKRENGFRFLGIEARFQYGCSCGYRKES